MNAYQPRSNVLLNQRTSGFGERVIVVHLHHILFGECDVSVSVFEQNHFEIPRPLTDSSSRPFITPLSFGRHAKLMCVGPCRKPQHRIEEDCLLPNKLAVAGLYSTLLDHVFNFVLYKVS